jgi:hypothetical protein
VGLKVDVTVMARRRNSRSYRELIPGPIHDLVMVLTEFSYLFVGERIMVKGCKMDSCRSVQNPTAGLMNSAVNHLLVLFKLLSFVTSRKTDCPVCGLS